jgi:hypothetical protein
MGGGGAGIDRMQLGINRLTALLGKRTPWMEAASRGYRNGIWGFSGKSLGVLCSRGSRGGTADTRALV